MIAPATGAPQALTPTAAATMSTAYPSLPRVFMTDFLPDPRPADPGLPCTRADRRAGSLAVEPVAVEPMVRPVRVDDALIPGHGSSVVTGSHWHTTYIDARRGGV